MKIVSWLMVVVLLFGVSLQTTMASPKPNKQELTTEQVKIQIVRLGVGDKAKATITTRDGAKIKGYVHQTGDDDFVMRDRKTDAPTTIRYADVTKIERSHGHSLARNILIGVSIGVAVVVVSVFAAIARNER